MDQTTLVGTVSIPLILGVVQVFKYAGLPTRFAPLADLVLGIGAGLISVWQATPASDTIPWFAGIVLGVTWGLSAAGLYEGSKNTTQAFTNKGGDPTPPVEAPVVHNRVTHPHAHSNDTPHT